VRKRLENPSNRDGWLDWPPNPGDVDEFQMELGTVLELLATAY
jgi:hypothetical protein